MGEESSVSRDTSRIVAAVAVVVAAGALCGVFFQSKNSLTNTANSTNQSPVIEQATEFESTPIDRNRLASLKKRYPAITREEAALIARAEAGKVDPMDTKMGAPGPAPDLTIDKTGRPTATAAARINAGRRDPMQPIEGSALQQKQARGTIASSTRAGVVPPPPPHTVPLSEMPYPDQVAPRQAVQVARKPQFLPAPLHLRLSAIVGERAIVLVPKELQIQNGWPRSFCLSKGDSIEDAKERRIQVASITQDSVVLEENGERFCKSLAPIH
jgi:hypothetical protein